MSTALRSADTGGKRCSEPRGIRGYLLSVAVVAAFTGLGLLSRELLSERDQGMILLLAIVLVAYREQRGPALLAVALSVAAFDFFFVLPYYTLAVKDTAFLVSFAAFAVVGITISSLTSKVRENERAAHDARLLAEAEQVRNALLSSVSHNLRTPLGSIIGSASTLRHQPLDEEARVEMLETIREEAEHLQRLLDNLLQMTRVSGGRTVVRKDWQLPEEIVGSALHRLGTASQNHRVAARIDPDVGLAQFDGLLIELALLNLLDNALKYSDEGSTVEVSVSLHGNDVHWEVRDEGIGVPEGEELRVFEKFYRIPGRIQRGSGLGLAIARAIVESHGGRIWLSERRDQRRGTSVVFALPLGTDVPELPGEAER